MFKSFHLISTLCFVLTLVLGFGTVLAQDDSPEIPEVEINSSAGTVVITYISFDNYGMKAGHTGIWIGFRGPSSKDDVFVTFGDSSTRYAVAGVGVSSSGYSLGFAVPIAAANSYDYTLHWAGNDPIPLDGDSDEIWIHEDACPDVAGVEEANGCPDVDTDGDEVSDSFDACPDVAGSPDADGCPDADEDTVADADDECPDESGSAQAAGCPDADGDGLRDTEDNCSDVRNITQNDTDGDGIGDACEDSDEDGFYDPVDNCPDEVGTADGCPDADEDGVADGDDACPDVAGGTKTAGCPDADNDGFGDAEDNCPDVKNPPQTDFNDDGIGDACQDSDEDGVKDSSDRCPDEVGTINGCPDTDEDGAADANDVCPDEAGPVDGCPDADEDGIADQDDACPSEAGLSELGGCPDADEDGVADIDDECPDEAGLPEMNGCLFTGTLTPGSGNVNLREGPGTEFDIVSVATSDDALQILGRNEAGDWLHIRIQSEDEDSEVVEAWIAGWLVTTEAVIDDLPVVE